MINIYARREQYKGFDIVVKLLGFFDDPSASRYWYCGYVRVPVDHKFYCMDYGEIERSVNVHGGITFFGGLQGLDGFYIGFDCGHGGDTPQMQDEEYTLNECMRLVDQLIEVGDAI